MHSALILLPLLLVIRKSLVHDRFGER